MPDAGTTTGTATGEANLWSAPGRVNLIGDHTDYNAGLALPFALQHRTRVSIHPRADRTVSASSHGHGEVGFATDTVPGQVQGWGAHVAGVVWAIGQHLGRPVAGAHLEVSSDVPVASGLSSSHSLECAVALAMLDRVGVDLEPAERKRYLDFVAGLAFALRGVIEADGTRFTLLPGGVTLSDAERDRLSV